MIQQPENVVREVDEGTPEPATNSNNARDHLNVQRPRTSRKPEQ